MMKKTFLFGVFAVVFIAIVLIGCTQLNSDNKKNIVASKINNEPIKIGAILPLTGNQQYIGESMRQGIELAVDEINNSNGISGRKLKVFFEDSQAIPATGISAFNALSAFNDINLFIVNISSVTLAVAPLAEKDKKIVFTIATSPKISNAGDYIFRNNLLTEDEMKVLADFIADDFKANKIAILFEQTDAGVDQIKVLESLLLEKNKKPVVIEGFEKDSKDFKTLLHKINALNPDAVYVSAYSSTVGLLLKQAKEINFETQFFSYWTAESSEFLETAGSAAENIIYSSPLLPKTDFEKKFIKKFEIKPEIQSFLAYDIVKLFEKAINECNSKSESAECIKKELYKINGFNGASGVISMDENGDTRKQVILKTVKNGKFVEFK